MQIPLYQIDAFANRPFEGNPAAICPLKSWLPDELLQSIAAENNLSETAYLVREGQGYRIRWFTPTREVSLCGHATLASAYVLTEILGMARDGIEFVSLSGRLTVKRDGEWFNMDFPTRPPQACDTPKEILSAFGITPVHCLSAEDYIVVFDDEQAIARPARILSN
jgi:PhzF family phenazine biosynthesis protein